MPKSGTDLVARNFRGQSLANIYIHFGIFPLPVTRNARDRCAFFLSVHWASFTSKPKPLISKNSRKSRCVLHGKVGVGYIFRNINRPSGPSGDEKLSGEGTNFD